MVRLNGRRIIVALVGLVTLLAAPGIPAAATHAARVAEADSLHRRARALLAEGTLDARRLAMARLERASLLDPTRFHVWLDLGQLCLEAGHRRRGRACYERAKREAPDDAAAYHALGTAWKWEWLNSFEDTALVRARTEFARATELAPDRAVAWGELSALELSRGKVIEAARAAERGRAADPGAWEPWVASACAAYRAGAMGRADSVFRAAIERVPEELRRRFDGVVLRLYEEDDGLGDPHPSFQGGVSSGRPGDPDLTTPENEAELDYLTRLGLALLLFRNARGLHWDMRTELFVRYGPPAAVGINPVWSPIAYRYGRIIPAPVYTPGQIGYPQNVQLWSYPELGLVVELWDRTLTQRFELPVASGSEPDPRPNPARLAGQSDLISLDRGRGVFRAMAPGLRPVPARGQVARFPGVSGAILLAHVATAGEPTDTLSGAWAVVASDGRVLTRGSGSLSTSSCDPTGQQVADFTVAAPPGDYRVHLTVSGSGGRRGLVRLAVTVPPADSGLVLSDLVMLCGLEGATVSPGTVRIEPDMERRVTGSRPLSVYFEIDRLTAGPDGQSRFAYTYSVVPARDDRAHKRTTPVAFSASREETHLGTRRRQFVTIPMRSVRRGSYELRIEVRDLIAGTVAAAGLRLEKT